MKNLGISQLIICGHSYSMADGEPLPPNINNDQPAADESRLLSRVRAWEEVNVTRQKQVLEWLQQASREPVVEEALAAGHLKIQAFFYMTESGLYQQYDPATKRFTTGQDC